MGGGIRRSHRDAAAVRFLAQAPAADHRCNRCLSRSLGRRGSALRRSDLDVFGCHDTAPDRRFDAMGLVLLLDSCEIVTIDPDGADLVTAGGARQRFYRRPLPPGTVSLWQLCAGEAPETPSAKPYWGGGRVDLNKTPPWRP
jgi:hypothetical protein